LATSQDYTRTGAEDNTQNTTCNLDPIPTLASVGSDNCPGHSTVSSWDVERLTSRDVRPFRRAECQDRPCEQDSGVHGAKCHALAELDVPMQRAVKVRHSCISTLKVSYIWNALTWNQCTPDVVLCARILFVCRSPAALQREFIASRGRCDLAWTGQPRMACRRRSF
jgi:hypothetical protein